ncbi:MAG: sulfatase-like hydrolase/transferase, partial [Clostridiales bacterium]|nr:sulfatase-like hydrolase/transferase [Clostridiales bacterium]
IQVYGLAAVFLVLLYRSPSGLVFYWLLNNVFSLVKNVFYKLKEPGKVLKILLAASGLALLITSLIRSDLDIRQKILLSIGSLLLILPLILLLVRKGKTSSANIIKDKIVFFSGTVMMALITGLLIPSVVLNDSPYEFIDIMGTIDPVNYISYSMILAFGSWVLWGSVFYFFMSDKVKALMARAVWIICGVSILDYMLFGTNLGFLSSALQYERKPVFSLQEYLINTLAVAAVAVAFSFFYKRFHKIAGTILIVGILTVAAIGGMNYSIVSLAHVWYSNHVAPSEEMPEIPLSKNGQNVIVFMLDRAMGTEVPYIFNEKPELKEKFDGFTYYPNTVSYGSWTLIGAPALYGGYEYTPDRINERDSESLVSKHNESLKVMPVLFGDEGYKVTVCDPSYAGYTIVPDLSIYDDHPEFNCYITNGRFDYFEQGEDGDKIVNTTARLNELRNRNFFCFSLMKVSPLLLQDTLYDDGAYNEAESVSSGDDALYDIAPAQHMAGISRSTGYYHDFLSSYSTLLNLSKMTNVSDSSDNTFLMICNDATHSPCLLQEPDYVPSVSVDNTEYDVDMEARYTLDGKTMQMANEKQVIHYHTNMAAFLRIGDWLDYLKENGVYDNTRIIFVSDHGRDLDQFHVFCNDKDMEFFMPLLMVKDFNAKGFTVSDEFMTNADTPALATSGIIDHPVNPFTGKDINSDAKQGPQKIFYSDFIDSTEVSGNTFTPGSWYNYQGNDPLDPSNWSYLGDG